MQKKCVECGILKEQIEYHIDRSKPDSHKNICKNCCKAYSSNRYKNNKDRIVDSRREYQANYYKTHKKDILINNYKNIKTRSSTNSLFLLTKNIRCLITNSITRQGYTKKSKTYNILGCSFEEFKEHIEKQFLEGMSWENRNLWHLDHIYPVSKAIDEHHLIELNHYTNFQPLWAEDNIKKGNKLLNHYIS